MVLSADGYEFLYVSYLFPPLLGGGVVRAEQACKLLPELGWKPTLLTCAVDGADEVDNQYTQKGVEVIRAYGVVRENLVRAKPRGSTKGTKSSFGIALLRLLARWLLLPDRQVLWKRAAQRLAIKAAGRHNWKCVLGTLHPITSAWVGQWVASRLGLPFILEFRDIISDKFEGGPPTALHRYFVRRIGRKLVHSASRIIVVSNSMKKYIAEKYNVAPDRVFVITSGFLPENKQLFNGFPVEHNDRFTMLYAGTFQRQRRPDTILKAVKKLIEQGKIPRDKLRVVFISNLMKSVISSYELDDVVETISMIPREEVFRWYRKSDLLLLICDKCDYQNVTIPGKLFEYLMTEKPILGLLDKNNEIAGILLQSGIGAVADAYDAEEVAQRIEKLYWQWNCSGLIMQPDKEFIEQFNFHRLVEKTVSILQDACGLMTNPNV